MVRCSETSMEHRSFLLYVKVTCLPVYTRTQLRPVSCFLSLVFSSLTNFSQPRSFFLVNVLRQLLFEACIHDLPAYPFGFAADCCMRLCPFPFSYCPHLPYLLVKMDPNTHKKQCAIISCTGFFSLPPGVSPSLVRLFSVRPTKAEKQTNYDHAVFSICVRRSRN